MRSAGVGAGRVDPFELLLSLVFAALAGLNLIIGPSSRPQSTILPETYRVVLYVLIILGAVAIVVGMLSPRVWGYVIEQLGCLSMGWALIIFGTHTTVLLWQADQLTARSGTSTIVVIALGAAYIWKRQRIWRDMKGIQEAENRLRAIKEGRLP